MSVSNPLKHVSVHVLLKIRQEADLVHPLFVGLIELATLVRHQRFIKEAFKTKDTTEMI